MIEVWLAFLTGLAGSPHCIGMCGGIVAALSLGGRGGAGRQLFQLLYNLGRVTTYTLLGIMAGAAGASLDLLSVREASFYLYLAANVLVVLIGVASAAGFSRLNLFSLETSGGTFLAAPLRWALSSASPWRGYPLGVVLGFLPCGLVYAPLAAAAGTGNPVRGGAIMAALGLGTLPLLFLFGSVSSVLSGRMKEGLFRLTGVLLALMGTAGLWRIWAKM